MKLCYAGSFDPLTFGHVAMIQRGLKMCDYMHIMVGVNPAKAGFIPMEDRIRLAQASLRDLVSNDDWDKMSWHTLGPSEITVLKAAELDCTHMLRGIRNATDMEYEQSLQTVNTEIFADIDTVFLMDSETAHISSSLVRSFYKTKNWEKHVRRYVPEEVAKYMVNMSKKK